MCSLPPDQRIANAAAVLSGRYGDVSRRAAASGTPRQALYRDTPRVLAAVEGTAARQQLLALQEHGDRLRRRVAFLEEQLGQAVVLDADRQAHFAATAQAEGVSLPVARRLLAVFQGQRAPSVATLGRLTHARARRAAELLQVLDEHSRGHVEQAAADEIFFGRQPCLMVVEQPSLCWVAGRLAAHRDGDEWAREFRLLPQLKQLSRDGGTGLAKGLALVNAERQRQERPTVADQEDHFHVLREGTRALRRMQGRVSRLMDKAEQAEARERKKVRKTWSRQGVATATARAWRTAERALDDWSRAERAWAEVSEAMRLFTPSGELNPRGRAEAAIAVALPALSGSEWDKARRALSRPELLTFLDQAAARLATVPVADEPNAAAVRQAAVEVEGLRRQPAALRGEGARAATLRGVLLAAGLVLALSGEAGARALAQVRQVLGGVWRASSLVECINSVARMQQSRHRRMTQGLLDLKRLYWNCREFRTGKRKKRTPYELLGLSLPTTDWWELLKLSPEQLRQQLSAPEVAA